MKQHSFSVQQMCLTAIFTALTAVFAQIAIPLPFTPAPVSFGMVGLYMAAILLPPRCAIFSQICYLLLGAFGLPVFGNFKGGPGALFGPTGGYLMVYPLMAAIVSFALNSKQALEWSRTHSEKRLRIRATAALCTAHLILYLGGTLWLSKIAHVSFSSGLAMGVYPFIPMDLLKITFCVTAVLPLRKRLMQTGLLSFTVPVAQDVVAE